MCPQRSLVRLRRREDPERGCLVETAFSPGTLKLETISFETATYLINALWCVHSLRCFLSHDFLERCASQMTPWATCQRGRSYDLWWRWYLCLLETSLRCSMNRSEDYHGCDHVFCENEI